jgi:hypothetical protein
MAAVAAFALVACQTPMGQYGFDNLNSGNNTGETAITTANVSTLTEKLGPRPLGDGHHCK